MFKKALLVLLTVPALVLSLAGCAPAAEGKVEVANAWVRVSEYSDHVGGMTGVFMKITNNTSKEVTLVGGESDIAPMVQVHQVVDGVMSERPEGIAIAPGETATLEPGGLHVMLMGLTRAILSGTKVNLTLKFKDGSTVKLPEMLAKVSESGNEIYTPTPTPSATN